MVFIVKEVAMAVAPRAEDVRLVEDIGKGHGGYADCEREG